MSAPAEAGGYRRRIEPLADGHCRVAWSTGAFETGHRALTPRVEGEIRVPDPLVLATLSGGARGLAVDSECGHRFHGADRAGAVSFVPAHCGRSLRLDQVRARWASFSLSSALFDGIDGAGGLPPLPVTAATNAEDAFSLQLLAACARQVGADGTLEPLYAEAMTLALAHHLAARARSRVPPLAHALPGWRMRRIEALVNAHLGGPLRIADLAAAVGLSPGHLHRAFASTLGCTPLAWITARRVARAEALMRDTALPVLDIAAAVGFASPGHFARVFRRAHGIAPAAWRRGATRWRAPPD